MTDIKNDTSSIREALNQAETKARGMAERDEKHGRRDIKKV